MAKQNAYSVRDSKVGTYGVPFFTHNDATAKRSFNQLASDPNSVVAHNPEDFSLHRIGEFDDESGVMECLPAPEFVANALLKPAE